MKSVFVAILIFIVLLGGFTFYKVGQADKSPPATAVHSENVTGTKVYSFSGSDDILTVMNGTVIFDKDEETFSGGILKMNSEEFFDGITSYTATFYILDDGLRNTVMINSVTDQTGGMVVFDGDDLGKISGEDVLNNYNADNTEDFINNLYFEISVIGAEGEKKTHQLHMDVIEVK